MENITKWIRRLFLEMSGLAWTFGGTGLVLITLSGETREYGIWITVFSFVLHMAGWAVDMWKGDES